MQREKQKRGGKKLLYIVALLISYLLQVTAFAQISIFGTKPVLLLAAAVGIALFENGTTGGVFGLIAGMLCDISFQQPTIVCTITFTAIGMVVGLLAQSVLTRGFVAYILCTFVAMLAFSLIQSVGAVLFSSATVRQALLVVWKQTAFSILFAVPLYFPVWLIGRNKPLRR